MTILSDVLGISCLFLCVPACGSSAASPPSQADASYHAADAAVPPSDGASHPASADCQTYLSCLAATNPQVYASALQLYGQTSACWATTGQANECELACKAAYAEVEYSCDCSGSECTTCGLPADNTWYSVSSADTPDGGGVVLCSGYEAFGTVMLEYDPIDSRAASFELPLEIGPSGTSVGFPPVVLLKGEFACHSPWVATATVTNPDQTWTASLTPAEPDGGTSALSVTLQFKGVPSSGGAPISCSDTFLFASTGP
jgi:hypothetical protein